MSILISATLAVRISNAHGQVIGIINMGVFTMEGLNFAIPARHVKYSLDHIDAFAYDAVNFESGFVYSDPQRHPKKFSLEIRKGASICSLEPRVHCSSYCLLFRW